MYDVFFGENGHFGHLTEMTRALVDISDNSGEILWMLTDISENRVADA